MQINFHIFQGSSISKSSTIGGIRQNHFWKEIFIRTERKNIHSFRQVEYFKWRRFLSSTLYFFTVIWTQTAGFVTALNSLSSLLRISCRFQFRNVRRAWNGQHWLFHNLALFSIYGNDGTTVSKRGVIINLKKYHWEKVQKGIPLSSNKLFSLNKQYISRKRWMLNYRNPIIFLEKPTTSCLDILGLHKKCRGRTHQIS